MPFTKTWNEDAPAGGDDAANGDNEIRDGKFATRERLAVDHYFYADESGHSDVGYHKQVTLPAQSTPAAVTGALRLYGKTASGATELHSLDASSNEYQLTLNGKLHAARLAIASEAQGDILFRGASLWQRLAAGTSGYFLKSQGAAADLVWAEVAFQTAATQAEMEAASSTTVPVTPGRAKYHPGVAKAWCMFDCSLAGTNAPTAGHNVTSVTKNGSGDYTVNLTTAFSSSSYVVLASAKGPGAEVHISIDTLTTSTIRITTGGSNALSGEDVTTLHVVAFGDQ